MFRDDDSFLKYTSIYLQGFVLEVVPRAPRCSAHIPHMGSTRQRHIRVSQGSNLTLETFQFPVDMVRTKLGSDQWVGRLCVLSEVGQQGGEKDALAAAASENNAATVSDERHSHRGK